eukprot:858529_1
MSSKVKFHVRKKRVKSSPIRTTKEQRKKQKAAKRKKKRLLSQQTQNKQRTTTKRLKLILRPNSNVSNHNHHPQRNNNSRVAVRSRSSQFDLDPDSENENMASANTPSALEKALAEAAKYKRLYHAEAQKVAAKNMDIYKLINEGALDSDHQGVDKAHLSIGGLTHINFVSQNTFEPWFIQATRDLVKIRMKCQILRNSKGLHLLTKILNLYCDALKQPRFNFNVGGTSYGSLDRVMQYKSFKLSYIHHGLDIMEGITRSSTLSIVALLGFQTIFSNNNQNHLPIESSQNITALKECSERVLGFQSETADDMSITRVLMNTIFAVQAMGIQFVDKYYHYLFTLELQQWIRIVTQLQGVYDIMIIDMRQRLSLQKYPEDRPIPKAALSSNDCCETSNGGAQHYQGKGPNMRDSTRAGHVCSDMNDPWYTIDHMIQYTRKDFEPFLKEWHQECGTYEEAIKESKQTKSTHETAKARNIHWKLNSSSQEVPARQRNIRLDKPRQIISVSLPLLNDTVWMEWIDERDKILSRYSGLGINMTKRQLKAELVRRLTANNISYTQRTGLDSMQRSLYNVCRMRIE